MKKIILLIIEKIRKALKVDEKGISFGWRNGILLLVALMMVGCDTNNIKTKAISGYDINVIEIDSCEYIISHVYYGQVIIHKQNCRFCKERRQKELKELVEQLKEKSS